MDMFSQSFVILVSDVFFFVCAKLCKRERLNLLLLFQSTVSTSYNNQTAAQFLLLAVAQISQTLQKSIWTQLI